MYIYSYRSNPTYTFHHHLIHHLILLRSYMYIANHIIKRLASRYRGIYVLRIYIIYNIVSRNITLYTITD